MIYFGITLAVRRVLQGLWEVLLPPLSPADPFLITLALLDRQAAVFAIGYSP